MYCTSTTLFIRARSNLLRRLRVLLIIPFLQQIRALRRDAPQSFRTICTVRTIMSSSASVADRCLPFIVSSTALPALDASQIAAGVYDNCNTGPSFFWRSFALTCGYKLPVLPPKYFVGPNCYVLRYARQIFSWVPNLHKRRISQPVLGFDITVRASAFTGAGVGINARLPDMALDIASILLFQSQKRHHAASKENKLLQRQRCLCHQLKIPPRKLRCTESSRGNLWCQTACLSRYRLIWSFCFAADHPETQGSSITSTSFFSSNFFTQPRSAFPALVAATLASSFS